MTPKHTIEIYELPEGVDSKIGYRILSRDDEENMPITDADYLVHSLSETLSHIGQRVNQQEEKMSETSDITLKIIENLNDRVIGQPQPLRDVYIQMNAYIAIALLRGRCGDEFTVGFLDRAKEVNTVMYLKETQEDSHAKH